MKYFILISDEILCDDLFLAGETLVPYCVEFSVYRSASRLRNETAGGDDDRKAEAGDDE